MLGDHVDVAGVHHLGDDGQPGHLADVGEDLQALDPQALEGVRRGARLERTAPEQLGARGLGHLGRLERLLGRLDGARAGDQGEGVRTDRHLVAGRADVDRGALGVVLQADQLERVGDPVHVLDTGHAAQVEAVEGLDVADQADDRAHDAAADERLSARLLDPLGDVGDLLLRRPRAITTTMGRG